MVLLCVLVALAAGCGGGGGGGGAPAPVDAGNSPGTGGSSGVELSISGTPDSEVVAGTEFSFTPTVDNPGRRVLTFSAVNLPRWAGINPTTGEISGTPGAADVGTYSGIRITVSGGGQSRTSLAYTIQVVELAPGSVTLVWSPPTQNADGTPLTDLAGYRIYYGRSPEELTRSVTIASAGVTSVVIENLTLAVWHFGATAYNLDGLESGISNVVSVEIM